MQTDRLNPSTLLDRVKKRLGIKSFILPFDDDELFDILYTDTLPTFSIYFPRYFRYIINVDKLKAADEIDGLKRRFYLNLDDLRNIQIIDIEDILPVHTSVSYFYDRPNISGLDAFSLTAELYQESIIDSMLSIPITPKFEPPNILNFEDHMYLHSSDLEIKFLICHAHDLSTIQFAQRDMLFKLFQLDLQINLYAELKHYDKIDTTFGTIDLKIDDWADAESKKEELIQKWEENFLAFREKTMFNK